LFNTALPHIPPQKPTHKAQRGGTSAVQPFGEIKKKQPFFDETKGSRSKKNIKKILILQFVKLCSEKSKKI
jgi:hypothetical protein